MQRIQKIIAEAGYASRRNAEELIKKGLVKVNGKKAILGDKADYNDVITINDVPINKSEEKVYYMLYKPMGYISSVKDEENRPTVLSLINEQKRIYPVGRLDYNTTGMLLLTNDGELTNILTHPKNKIPKVYLAKINKVLTGEEIYKIKNGIMIDNRLVKPSYFKVKKTNKKGETSSIRIAINEGRNHIVKRIFESLGLEVIRLKREAIGFLTLGDLRCGAYRPLSIKEVKRLYAYKNNKKVED